ncbi:MAG: signal peptidase I [Pseudomonadales bacterium]|nr:signal peptidase I [Pseudomonadales bacterium]
MDVYLFFNHQASFFNFILFLIATVHILIITRKVEQPQSNIKFYNKWWGVLSIPLCLFLVFFLVRSFIFEPFKVVTKVMNPNLHQGEMLIIKKWGYGSYGTYSIDLINLNSATKKPKRGDIFVFTQTVNNQTFLMRIIGLPNDEINLNKSVLMINNEIMSTHKSYSQDMRMHILDESLDGNTYEVQYNIRRFQDGNYSGVVPENHYFVLGDNRDQSNDSRYWGFLPESNLVGKLIYKW